MNQLKFFKALTIMLVILNVAVIAFLFLSRGHHPHHPPHSEKPLFEIVGYKLNFDEQQEAKYKTLREKHHGQMMELDKSRNRLLKEYFKAVEAPGKNESELADLMNQIQQLEQQRITITYDHFNDVKTLCKEEQLKKFPKVLELAIERLLSNEKKGSPHPEK